MLTQCLRWSSIETVLARKRKLHKPHYNLPLAAPDQDLINIRQARQKPRHPFDPVLEDHSCRYCPALGRWDTLLNHLTRTGIWPTIVTPMTLS